MSNETDPSNQKRRDQAAHYHIMREPIKPLRPGWIEIDDVFAASDERLGVIGPVAPEGFRVIQERGRHVKPKPKKV